LGHGNTNGIVLAPTNPQEMLDLTIEAFQLTFKYRNPVFIFADGYLGQMTGRVQLPRELVKPGIPSWAVYGDAAHRSNLINSIWLIEPDLEKHNEDLNAKYDRIRKDEQRASTYKADDAEILILACNTPARMAKGAVEELRKEGLRVGLFNPITLWPFPIDHLTPLLDHVDTILVVEASAGQLEDELRLALSHAGRHDVEIDHLRHMGGVLPQKREIVEAVQAKLEVAR
jgi:pyruvate/2-oxoacid:ferredoxin oxidoreductase alpha subunit